jgi:hypothetical protein
LSLRRASPLSEHDGGFVGGSTRRHKIGDGKPPIGFVWGSFQAIYGGCARPVCFTRCSNRRDVRRRRPLDQVTSYAMGELAAPEQRPADVEGTSQARAAHPASAPPALDEPVGRAPRGCSGYFFEGRLADAPNIATSAASDLRSPTVANSVKRRNFSGRID